MFGNQQGNPGFGGSLGGGFGGSGQFGPLNIPNTLYEIGNREVIKNKDNLACVAITAKPKFRNISVHELRANDYFALKKNLVDETKKREVGQLIQTNKAKAVSNITPQRFDGKLYDDLVQFSATAKPIPADPATGVLFPGARTQATGGLFPGTGAGTGGGGGLFGNKTGATAQAGGGQATGLGSSLFANQGATAQAGGFGGQTGGQATGTGGGGGLFGNKTGATAQAGGFGGQTGGAQATSQGSSLFANQGATAQAGGFGGQTGAQAGGTRLFGGGAQTTTTQAPTAQATTGQGSSLFANQGKTAGFGGQAATGQATTGQGSGLFANQGKPAGFGGQAAATGQATTGQSSGLFTNQGKTGGFGGPTTGGQAGSPGAGQGTGGGLFSGLGKPEAPSLSPSAQPRQGNTGGGSLFAGTQKSAGLFASAQQQGGSTGGLQQKSGTAEATTTQKPGGLFSKPQVAQSTGSSLFANNTNLPPPPTTIAPPTITQPATNTSALPSSAFGAKPAGTTTGSGLFSGAQKGAVYYEERARLEEYAKQASVSQQQPNTIKGGALFAGSKATNQTSVPQKIQGNPAPSKGVLFPSDLNQKLFIASLNGLFSQENVALPEDIFENTDFLVRLYDLVKDYSQTQPIPSVSPAKVAGGTLSPISPQRNQTPVTETKESKSTLEKEQTPSKTEESKVEEHKTSDKKEESLSPQNKTKEGTSEVKEGLTPKSKHSDKEEPEQDASPKKEEKEDKEGKDQAEPNSEQ